MPKRARRISIYVAIGLLVYLLLMGPIVHLVEKKIVPEATVIIYLPIFRLAYESPLFYRPINSYLNYWGYDLD
jgi:hypothetical protein